MEGPLPEQPLFPCFFFFFHYFNQIGTYDVPMAIANSLDPDQARQNVGPDLDPNCLTF